MIPAWQPLGAVDPEQLAAARLLVHHAAQLVPRLVRGRVPAEPGFAHLALAWEPAPGALAGRPVPSPVGPVRLGVRVADLALALLGDRGVIATFPLGGRTAADAEAWPAALGFGPLSPLFRYDLPLHRCAEGAAFAAAGQGAALAELTRYFANAALRLEPFGPARCWPHHLDLSVLLARGTGSSGLGLSPGDRHDAQPHLYAYPWPCPDRAALPPLEPPTFWHTEGFTGAVLLGRDLCRLPEQETGARMLLGRMAEACAAALGSAAA
jgi:hypothetical protein